MNHRSLSNPMNAHRQPKWLLCLALLCVPLLASLACAGDHRRLSPHQLQDQQRIGPDPAVQHYGYITVNGTYENGAHLFYWMFEARHNPETAPLVRSLSALVCLRSSVCLPACA